MNTTIYPKLLIVNGDSIASRSGTGFTLGNLFAGWPKEKLAQIYTTPGPHECRAVYEYRLHPTDRRGISWLRGNRSSSRTDRISDNTDYASRSQDARSIVENAIKPVLRDWMDLIPYKLPDEVKRNIVRFRPEIVYTLMGNIQISSLALRCAELCKARIVPHFMDDWLSTAYAGRPDLIIQRRLLLSAVSRIMREAPIGLAISDFMAREYTSAYGVPCYGFMNCVSVPEEIRPEPPIDPIEGPRLVFVGGLHLERWRSLKEIGEALTYLKSEGIHGRLYIYAPVKDISDFSNMMAGDSVTMAGSLKLDHVADVLKGGHILVHVETFKKNIRRYTRLSISTKIPQYMASGRPLLSYGPGEVASCCFIEKNECGLVVGVQDKSELITALRKLLQDSTLRARLGAKAWATAQQRFNAREVRERFRSVIAQATWRSGIELETPTLDENILT
jgi:glycosyltransferase involved in cell wall biosynthesis